jgi:microcystin-dependent protein
MGNSAAGRLSASYFGATATVLGAAGGAESLTLTLAQLPTGIATSSASASVTLSASRFIPQTFNPMATVPVSSTGALYSIYAPSGAADWVVNSSTITGTLSAGVTATSTNTNGNAHRTVQPTMLATIYLKL